MIVFGLLISTPQYANGIYKQDIKSNSSSIDVTNCEFYIYSIESLPNGKWKVCIKTLTSLAGFSNFEIYTSASALPFYQTSDPDFCIILNTPFFDVKQYNTDHTSCFVSYYVSTDENCPPLDSLVIDKCEKTVSFVPNTSLFADAYIDFGDGSPIVVLHYLDTIPYLTHTYLTHDVYNICITFNDGETTMVCCYPINLIICDNSDFVLAKDSSSASCLKPRFHEEPVCKERACESIWEYEDGTVYYGDVRPHHYFTNFANFDDSVWVKHTMICCGDTSVSVEKIVHPNGAFIGNPDASVNMTDSIHWSPTPELSNNPPYNMTIYDFIKIYSVDPTLDLLIDGQLIVDEYAEFLNGGQWNMGMHSEILVDGNVFSITGVNIWSAVNLSPSFQCCDLEYTWKGITSHGSSTIRIYQSTISNALAAVHYPGASVNNSNAPRLSMVNSSLLGNMFGILNRGEYIKIRSFSGNFIRGKQDCICTCDVVNGIDFRNVSVPIVFPAGNTNEILQYEQGVHADNASLTLRNLYIHDLDDYNDITPWYNLSANDSRIGISYKFTANANSNLTIEDCNFNEIPNNDNKMRTGVREFIEYGNHTLTANSYGSPSTIKMDKIENGYDLFVDANAHIYGSIIGNSIITSAGSTNSSEAISLSAFSSNNQMRINANHIEVNGGSVLSQGITLNSLINTSQDFKVLNNPITQGATATSGSSIQLSNCQNSEVVNNTIISDALRPAIEIIQGGQSNINCNDVTGGRIGLRLHTSPENNIISNTLFYNLENSLFAQSNCMGINGSVIALNNFDNSGQSSVFYDKTCTTGIQNHDAYNNWLHQSGVEVYHQGSLGAWAQCKYNAPSGVTPPSIHYPLNYPTNIVIHMTSVPIFHVSSPCHSFSEEIIGNTESMDSIQAIDRYASLASDTSLSSSLTVAEYGHFKQTVMEILTKNPSWLTSNSILNSFYSTESSTFIGKSVWISNNLNVLQQNLLSQQSNLQVGRNSLEGYTGQIIALKDSMEYMTDTDSIEQMEVSIANCQLQMNSISELIDSLQSVYNTQNDTLITNISTINAALSCSEDYQTYERDMNTLAIKLLKGLDLTETEKDNIRDVAMECYSDAGRAEYAGRNLAMIYLKEYYLEDTCNERSIQNRSNTETKAALNLFPNPAKGYVTASLDNSFGMGRISFSLYNRLGQVVLNQVVESNGASMEFNIDIAKMLNGLYLVRIKSDIKSVVEKLIIQQ